MSITTIQIDKSVLEELKSFRKYPRQTYNELIKDMLHMLTLLKQSNQYDEFLHKIQQPKMQELWDNEDDNKNWG
jgi:hypothetical protein